MEEAITSSQLEGASTTREAAKQMIRSGRAPLDRSERMILNNYSAVHLIREFKDEALTPEVVFKIHDTLTEGTLDVGPGGDYLRTPEDDIAVYHRGDGTLLHTPPAAQQIPRRMAAVCDFANRTQTDAFLHPIVKAIVLHFWLAYDHPFIDGNGRTARALFYWSVLSQGLWLFEFLSISAIIRKAPAGYALYDRGAQEDPRRNVSDGQNRPPGPRLSRPACRGQDGALLQLHGIQRLAEEASGVFMSRGTTATER